MAEKKFKIGEKVRIKGDPIDTTDHLDGKTGIVRVVRENDMLVDVGSLGHWMIWNHNARPVKKEIKFCIGDRVRVDNLTGTVICISMGDMLGVQFDDEQYSGHRCLGVKLKAGSPSTKCNCWWVKPQNAHRIHVKNNHR
jgi:hypothetical protein